MRQEEVEIEEKTVERVYCDECGDECTDAHNIEPIEVCQNCSTGSTYDKYEAAIKSLADSDIDNNGKTPDVSGMVIIGVLWPIVLPALLSTLWDDTDNAHTDNAPSKSDILFTLTGTLGTMLWTAIGAFIILEVPL